jgi:TetR/AcrR family transcriptional regulator
MIGVKTRDAERSRAAILDAAEQLFAERGFDGASLGDIAGAAALSRATPSYFYGNKEQLYAAVLERVFAERDVATREAFEPLVSWAREDGSAPLDAVLAEAVAGYMDFLQRRPAFVRLIQREELSGGRRLHSKSREPRAMTEAFEALGASAGRRGLRSFRVDDAVLLLVSLTFSPIAQRRTFMASLGRDLSHPATLQAHIEFVVGQLLHLLR